MIVGDVLPLASGHKMDDVIALPDVFMECDTDRSSAETPAIPSVDTVTDCALLPVRLNVRVTASAEKTVGAPVSMIADAMDAVKIVLLIKMLC